MRKEKHVGVDSEEAGHILDRLRQNHGILNDRDVFFGTGARVKKAAAGVLLSKKGESEVNSLPEKCRPELVTAQDLEDGEVEYNGRVIVNIFDDKDELLRKEERVYDYINSKKEYITKRASNKIKNGFERNGYSYFYTLEGRGRKRSGKGRFYYWVKEKEKLLLPKVRHPLSYAYDPGEYYPYGNILFAVADNWDIEALSTVLQSSITEFSVSESIVEEGEEENHDFPFEPHHTEKIPLPPWHTIKGDYELIEGLREAGRTQDRKACDEAVQYLFDLNEEELKKVRREVGRNPRERVDLATSRTPGSSVNHAIQTFWQKRNEGVREDAHMQAVLELLTEEAERAGLEEDDIHKDLVTIPAYFRPTKAWDVLVVNRGVLIAALEIKSQVRKEDTNFGQNINNRCEEAIGSATDLRQAVDEGLFPRNEELGLSPFCGYIMILEDCPDSRTPLVDLDEPHFVSSKEFFGKTVAERYEIALRRLCNKRIYDSAAVVVASNPFKKGHENDGRHGAVTDAMSIESFLVDLSTSLQSAVHKINGTVK